MSAIFLSNRLFLGNSHTIRSNLGDAWNPETDLATHAVIYQLSPELYKAFRGIAAHEATRRNIFVHPVPAYNSIKGGVGFFGGSLVHTVELDSVTHDLRGEAVGAHAEHSQSMRLSIR